MNQGIRRLAAALRASALLLALPLAACNDTVFEVVPATGLTITGGTATAQTGQTIQLNAQVVGDDGRPLSGRTITWTSSNDAIATVNATGQVTTRTPGPVTITASAEGRSAQHALTVSSPVPAITSVSPLTTPPNSPFTLTVMGSGFYSGSVIRWNGANRTTTFVSSTELRAAITASDLGVQGPVSITVLNASPGGGTSNTATFTVRPADACQYFPPHTIPSTVTGRIETTDCRLSDQTYADGYALTIATAQVVTFTMNAASTAQTDAFLYITDTSGRFLAYNDDTGGSLNSTLRVMLAPGSYRLWANTAVANQTGDYTLTSAAGPNANTGCVEIFMTTGLTATQTLSTSDCLDSSGFYHDDYKIQLVAGQVLTVSMNSTDMDAYLILRNAAGTIVAEDDDSGGGNNARLTFTVTAATAGTYTIEATTYNSGTTGSYTLTVP